MEAILKLLGLSKPEETEEITQEKKLLDPPPPFQEFNDVTEEFEIIEDGYLIENIVQILTIVAVLGVATYYSYKYIMSYMGAQSFSVIVTFPMGNRPLRVGQTITSKLVFSETHENGQETLCTVPQIARINENLKIQLYQQEVYQNITILKNLTKEKNAFIIRFSVRKSGQYKIVCKYEYFPFVGSPSTFDVLPGSICHHKTSLQTPNPTIISISVDTLHSIGILPLDRYGNICTVEDEDIQKFKLDVKLGESLIDSSEVEHEFCHQGGVFTLKIKANKCNIYKCSLTCGDTALQYHSFILNCMSLNEDEKLQAGFQSFFRPLPGSAKGSLLAVGTERKQVPQEIWISVNSSQISISSCVLGIIYYPFLAFCINRRTKINFNGLHEIDPNENESTVSLKISDGIQDSVIIALVATDARIFLATFGHFQGQRLTKSSFKDKKKTFEFELGGFLKSFSFSRPYKVLKIDQSDVLQSSIREAPTTQGDWTKAFLITLTGVQETPKRLETDKWLSILIQTLFEHNHERDNTTTAGLFFKHIGSRLLHPNAGSKRSPRWGLQEFEFAGTVLAKCLFEAVVNGACINLTHIRFTKSFLAQLIGIPITYKHFETDDPFYNDKHVIPVLNCTDDETCYRFLDPEGVEPKVNLIPNGNNIPVNKRNKENYLNLLANERLRNKFKEELNAFRTGFYMVIPQGLIADFDEDELEKLLCGGGKSFQIEDLRKNCRIIGTLLDNPGLSHTDIPGSNFPEDEQQKILSWFWTVLSNMSDEEREKILKMTTGSFVLPSCGFKDLSPKFTIALIGSHDEPPTGHPSLHQISIGNHSSFEKFESNLINSLYDPADQPEFIDSAEGTEDTENNDQIRLNRQIGQINRGIFDCIPWVNQFFR